MLKVKYDQEILYVHKVYYFISMWLLFTFISLIIAWKFCFMTGFIFFILGSFIAYLMMIKKKAFIIPPKKVIAQNMAKEIIQHQSFIAISHFASQLYFYLDKPNEAINLLQNYSDAKDPLLSATLADILLREGYPQKALEVINENPFTSTEPLLLFIKGNTLRQIDEIKEAMNIYEKSLHLARKKGFPSNGTNRFTRFILSLSYKASVHHHLGDCYWRLSDDKNARKHYVIGNLHLLDFTLWQRFPI